MNLLASRDTLHSLSTFCGIKLRYNDKGKGGRRERKGRGEKGRGEKEGGGGGKRRGKEGGPFDNLALVLQR